VVPSPRRQEFDGSGRRRKPSRSRTPEEIEELIVKMPRENPSWSYSIGGETLTYEFFT
jgi:hypothetical protein